MPAPRFLLQSRMTHLGMAKWVLPMLHFTTVDNEPEGSSLSEVLRMIPKSPDNVPPKWPSLSNSMLLLGLMYQPHEPSSRLPWGCALQDVCPCCSFWMEILFLHSCPVTSPLIQ